MHTVCPAVIFVSCCVTARSHFGFRAQTYLWFLGLPKVEWETKLLPCGISSQFGFKIENICFLKFKVGSVVYASSSFSFLSHNFLQACMDSSAAAGSINLPGIYCSIVCFFFHFFLVIPAAGVRRLWAFLFLFPTVTVEDLLEFSWDVKHLCMGFAVTGSTPTSHSKKIWPCSQLTPVFVRMGKRMTSFYLFCTDVFHFELNMRASYVYLIDWNRFLVTLWINLLMDIYKFWPAIWQNDGIQTRAPMSQVLTLLECMCTQNLTEEYSSDLAES